MIIQHNDGKVDINASVIATIKHTMIHNDGYISMQSIRRQINEEWGNELITKAMMKQIMMNLVTACIRKTACKEEKAT